VRIYAPGRQHEDLLPYLVRRLLENGANTSFVHAFLDEEVPAETSPRGPFARPRRWIAIPSSRLRRRCMANTVNSAGHDLTQAGCAPPGRSDQARSTPRALCAAIVDGKMKTAIGATLTMSARSISDYRSSARSCDADGADVDSAFETSPRPPSRAGTRAAVRKRAEILRAMADALEANTDRCSP
jgi:RHH-type proline utilization regulon transcriptional repressor/proline dehydrogenase/delta 1-pyrroline-5-carboxylate dehydrogenase